MYSVVQFFETAGYVVDAVGFTFILTGGNEHEFQLGTVEGQQFLSSYNVVNSDRKWDMTNFAACLSMCTMTTSSST